MSDGDAVQEFIDEAGKLTKRASGREGAEARKLHSQAADCYLKAATAIEEENGKHDSDTLHIRNLWAISLRNAGEVDKAIEAHTENLARYRQCEPRQPDKILKIQRHLAENYAVQLNYEKALPIYRTIVKAVNSDSSATAFRDRLNQALAIYGFGRMSKDVRKMKYASELNAKILEQATTSLGEKNILIVEFRYHLCAELLALGKYEDARVEIERNVAICEGISKPEYSRYLEKTKRLQEECSSKMKATQEEQEKTAKLKELILKQKIEFDRAKMLAAKMQETLALLAPTKNTGKEGKGQTLGTEKVGEQSPQEDLPKVYTKWAADSSSPVEDSTRQEKSTVEQDEQPRHKGSSSNRHQQLKADGKLSSGAQKSRPRSADSLLRASEPIKTSHRHRASADMTGAEREDIRRLANQSEVPKTKVKTNAEDSLGSYQVSATSRFPGLAQQPQQALESSLTTIASSSQTVPSIKIVRTDTAGSSELEDSSLKRRLGRTQTKDDLAPEMLGAPKASSTNSRRAASAEPQGRSASSGELFSSPEHQRKYDEWFEDVQTHVHELLRYNDDTIPKISARKVKIAILDTGVASKSGNGEVPPRLKSPRLHRGKELDQSLPWNEDDNGHGTHAAGLILSVCPYADLYVYRIVKNREDEIRRNYVKDALTHAIDSKGVDIISMSFGWPEDNDTELQDLILRAKSKRVLLFAATSNDGFRSRSGIAYPARSEDVIGIDAANEEGKPLGSNPRDTSPSIRFTAPGLSVLSTYPTHLESSGQKRMSGSSCATPIAAATAACVLVFARQRPLCLDPSVEPNLKSITGMKSVLKELLTSKDDDHPRWHHLDPTKLFDCRGQAGGGDWYDFNSARHEAAWKIIVHCLRKNFSPAIGSGLAKMMVDEQERRKRMTESNSDT